jgi:hypothetical protein
VTIGVWVGTDRRTFESWTRAWSGLALPQELRPPGLGPSETGAGERGSGETGSEETGPDERGDPGTPVPPLVAASLAVHGCAELAVTVRLTLPEGERFACFGVAGDLAAGLIRSGSDVQIGLFGLDDLVDEVVRLVPARSPAPSEAASACVRITVLTADEATPGWQQILIAGDSQWRRIRSDPNHMVLVSDVHRELAADLRFVIIGCLTGPDHG